MKIFAIDLDGTLLLNNGLLLESDADRLIEVQKRGHCIVLATGRNMQEAKQIIDRLKINQYNGAVILADGQYIYHHDRIIERPFIEWTEANEFYKWIPSDVQVSLTTPSFNYYLVDGFMNPRYFKLKLMTAQNKHNKVITTQGIRGVDKIEKIVVDVPEERISLEQFKGRFEIAYIHDKKRYEIKHKGVNKGESLQLLLIDWHVDIEELYVFGNDDNDISLMKMTPNSYAMSNGTAMLKKYASSILTDSPSVVVNTIEEHSHGGEAHGN